MRKALIVTIILLAAVAAVMPASHASKPAAPAGLENFEILSPADLSGLDGMGGNYLDSLPEGVLEQLSQLENLENLKINYADSSTHTATVGVWDSAFQNAHGIMALVQIAGNDNIVDLHLHLNIFFGGTFVGDFSGDWLDLSDFLHMSSL